MDSPGCGEPPAKRARFFAEPPADGYRNSVTTDGSSTSSATRGAPPNEDYDDPLQRPPASSPYAIPSSKRPTLSDDNVENIPTRLAAPTTEAGPSESTASPRFDRATFEAFVGGKVDVTVLGIIQENCGDDMEKAVNMYFDGTWKTLKRNPAGPGPRANPPASSGRTGTPPRASPRPTTSGSYQSTPSSRYIGAFGVEGWATRSGTSLLKHGDIVRIERQKIQPPQPAALKGKAKLGNPAPIRTNSAAAKRVDVIVRFTDASGTELGRLEKGAASWISTLIDQKVCKFEGTCVFAPEKWRTNDTVFLQLRCSLLQQAFSSHAFMPAENRTTGIFEEKETSEERGLRMRQVALVRLFQEINLSPTRLNAAAAKHKRQGLLDAAELAEKKEKEASKSVNR